MAATALTREQLAAYRTSARARAAARRDERERRRTRAWSVARRAADLLRREFGATRVVVFGSLAEGSHFDERSDVDVAAWGIAYEDLWRAWGAVSALDTLFEVDLVRAEEASPRLIAAIEEEAASL